MSQSSFFNVGGTLVENYLDGHDELPDGKMPRMSSKRNPILVDEAIAQGASVIHHFVSDGTSGGYDTARASRAVGRARRVEWALASAATLALADGPIPVGDAIAIAFLAGFAVYEGVGAVKDIIQYD